MGPDKKGAGVLVCIDGFHKQDDEACANDEYTAEAFPSFQKDGFGE